MITDDDRSKELRILLSQMRDFPSRDWDRERDRVVVLRQMLAGQGMKAH